jgi:hypothetical protein
VWEIRGPRGKINELTSLIKSSITVIRALARVHEEVDTNQVDEYLVENGAEPGDFIRDEGELTGYSAERERDEQRQKRRQSSNDD